MAAIADETSTERIERKSKKNMLLGTIFGYIAIGVSIVYGLFLTPEIVEVVGESDYGLYGLTASIMAMLLVDFGLTNTINTYLAKLRANNDKEGVQRFLAGIFKLYFMVDIVFAVIVAAVYFATPYMFGNTYNPDQIQILQYLVLIVGGFAMISVPCSCFTAVMSTYEKFSIIKLLDIFQKVLYLALSVASIYVLEGHWRILGIVVANVGSGLFAIILRFLYMRFYIGIKLDLRLGISRKEMKSVLSFSSWGFIITICSRLVITVTPFILGIMSTDVQVTLFSLVVTIETYIFMFGEMVSSFFMAKIARTDSENVPEEEKKQHLQTLVEKIGKIEFIVIGLIMAGWVSVGREFVLVWMKGNEDYLPIYWCIILICGYEIFHIPQLALQNAMYTHGHIAPVAITQIVKAVVNLSLSFWLSSRVVSPFGPENGAFGASVAICAACIAELIVSNIMYKKYLGISLLHYFASIYIGGGITMAATIAVGMVLRYFMPLDNQLPTKLVLDGIIVVAVYIMYTFYFTFNRQERRYYKNVLRRMLRLPEKEYKSTKIQNVTLKREIFNSVAIINGLWALALIGVLIYMLYFSQFTHWTILAITVYFSVIPILIAMVVHRMTYAENKKDLIIPIICCLLLTSVVSAAVLLFVNPSGYKKVAEQPVEVVENKE